MAHSEEWEVVPADSPDRCQASFSNGNQCRIKKVEGSDYCVKHQFRGTNGRSMRLYQIGAYQRRFEDFLNNPNLRSLHEEVGLARMTLESIVRECGADQKKLILFSSKILEMVKGIKETIQACHKLELSMGKLLDKNQIVILAERIIAIIALYVPDPATLELIGNEILQAVEEISKPIEQIANHPEMGNGKD